MNINLTKIKIKKKVKEGNHIDILLKTQSVAFSVFRKVNNLMRGKLENLFNYIRIINI